MRVVDLALKDLLQILRDRKTVIFLILMPLAFTAFFGVIFGPSGPSADPRLPVGVINQDGDGRLSAGLLGLLEASNTVRPVLLAGRQASQAGEAVRDGKLAAALTLPAGFTAQAWASGQPRLTAILDRQTTAGQTAYAALQAALLRLGGALQSARLAAEVKGTFADEAARQAYLEESVALALAAWQNPPITLAVEGVETTQIQVQAPSGFVQSSPGMIVQFAIYGLLMAATVLVLERNSGTLQRLLTTSLTRGQIIAGKLLAMFTITFMQELILVLVGQFVFRVDYLRAPLATLVVMVALALWAASLGLLIGALSKGEEQVIMWTLIAMFLLSALGGAWFSLEFTGKTFATIGHLLPSAWAMEGFQNIIVRGLGLPSVVKPALLLLGYAAVCFGLATWRLRLE